jgi:hypothetical protein
MYASSISDVCTSEYSYSFMGQADCKPFYAISCFAVYIIIIIKIKKTLEAALTDDVFILGQILFYFNIQQVQLTLRDGKLFLTIINLTTL